MPGASPTPASERDQRVVHDQDAGLVTDAGHDGANDGRIAFAIHTGHAEADRRG